MKNDRNDEKNRKREGKKEKKKLRVKKTERWKVRKNIRTGSFIQTISLLLRN